jgi:hypothetical protein
VAFLTALAGLALGLLGFVRGPGWCALIGFVAVVGTIACVGFLTVGIVHVGWTVRRGRRRRRENRVIAALRAGAAV